MSKLEAITICVNYDDFLEITLPRNIKHFDKYYIVTTPTDTKTIQVCQKVANDNPTKIHCITTDVFTWKGAKFNKGAAIDLAIQNLKYQDWVGTIDSDTLLHNTFRQDFLDFATDIECSYASRRYDVPTFNEWKEIDGNPDLIKTKRLYRGIGYGNNFFWNYRSNIFQDILERTGGWPYPNWFPHVAESDWMFRNLWSDWIYDPRLNDDPIQHELPNNDRAANPDKLKQLPFHCIHLGETGRNESSRVTRKFEYEPI